MDIGTSEITAVIASSTTSYLGVFSPVFLLIGGLLLAVIIVIFLISLISGRPANFSGVFGDDEEK
jgi:hypothetical protein